MKMKPTSLQKRHITVALFLSIFCFNLYTGSSLAQRRSSEEDRLLCSPVSSVIDEKIGASWKIRGQRIDTKDKLFGINFIDSQNGWIAGERLAYRTVDGGGQWERIDFNTPANFIIRKIVFVNPSIGWVLLERSGFDPEKKEIWLMHTADAGRSWQVQLKRAGAFDPGISFADEERGWLIFNVYTHPGRYSSTILQTTNQGQTWKDVSEPLLKMLGADNKECCTPKVSSVVADSERVATLLTYSGRLFSTMDGGSNWKEIISPCAENKLSYLGKLFGKKESGYLWMADGAFSLEGAWGKIYEQQANGSWLRYELPDFALSGAVYISESQVLAAGSLIDRYEGTRSGAILYSSDSGRTWSIVYRNEQITAMRALTSTDSNHVWAVSENGLIVKLELIKVLPTQGKAINMVGELNRNH